MTKRTVTRTYRLQYMNVCVFLRPLLLSRTIWILTSECYLVFWRLRSLETIFSFPLIGNIVRYYRFPPHTHGRKYRFLIALLRENHVFYFEYGCTDFDIEGLMDRRRTPFNKNEVCLFSSLNGKYYYLLKAK
jgi:hypothetical protein